MFGTSNPRLAPKRSESQFRVYPERALNLNSASVVSRCIKDKYTRSGLRFRCYIFGLVAITLSGCSAIRVRSVRGEFALSSSSNNSNSAGSSTSNSNNIL